MDINDAACARGQARLNKSVVLREVILVDITRHGIVRQELPANGETKDVEPVIVDEMLHLALTVVAVVLQQWRPSAAGGAATVGVASEVESSDVDTCEAELACRRRWC